MSDILQETENGVMTLTFNRAHKKNSLTTAMYADLADSLAAAVDDDAVRVVLIQGNSEVFCAGNDLEDFLNAPAPSSNGVNEKAPVQRFLENIAQLPKPIVASVCGPAVGIGTTMLLHCDLVYAGDNASLVLPFVNLGLCPEAASSLLLPMMVGYHRAAAALMLGEPIDAATALSYGLVNKVASADAVAAIAHERALKLAAKPLSALMQTKALMKSGQNDIIARMEEERTHFQRLMHEPAAREAFSAFLEKRKPNFAGL